MPDRKLFDAVIATIAEQGLDEVSLRDIAAKADLSLAELYDRIPHRHAIVPFLAGEVDRAVLADAADISLDQSPRDRLFEIMMSRFDQLQPMRKLFDAARARPALSNASIRLFDALAGALSLPRSMACTLEAAGLSSAGLAGAVRVRGLALVYLSTLRIWVDDRSEDLGSTMKTLDQQLARAERWAERLTRALPRKASDIHVKSTQDKGAEITANS